MVTMGWPSQELNNDTVLCSLPFQWDEGEKQKKKSKKLMVWDKDNLTGKAVCKQSKKRNLLVGGLQHFPGRQGSINISGCLARQMP